MVGLCKLYVEAVSCDTYLNALQLKIEARWADVATSVWEIWWRGVSEQHVSMKAVSVDADMQEICQHHILVVYLWLWNKLGSFCSRKKDEKGWSKGWTIIYL